MAGDTTPVAHRRYWGEAPDRLFFGTHRTSSLVWQEAVFYVQFSLGILGALAVAATDVAQRFVPLFESGWVFGMTDFAVVGFGSHRDDTTLWEEDPRLKMVRRTGG